MKEFQVERGELWIANSILCLPGIEPIETWWFDVHPMIELVPSGELSYPVDYTY
jgi:hypothetical protein